MQQLYVAEILGLMSRSPQLDTLPKIIHEVIKGENEFQMNRIRMQAKNNKLINSATTATGNEYTCDNCGDKAQIQNKYILQMPNVFTIGLQWIENIEIENDEFGRFKEDVNKKDIEKLLGLIPCTLDLTDFYQTQQS